MSKARMIALLCVICVSFTATIILVESWEVPKPVPIAEYFVLHSVAGSLSYGEATVVDNGEAIAAFMCSDTLLRKNGSFDIPELEKYKQREPGTRTLIEFSYDPSSQKGRTARTPEGNVLKIVDVHEIEEVTQQEIGSDFFGVGGTKKDEEIDTKPAKTDAVTE